MTTQNITVIADVPADQDVAAQAAAASFVTAFTADVEGSTVLAATYGGVSLLPSPADEWAAAVADLDALKTGKPTAADVAAAVDRVQGAAKAYELSLTLDNYSAEPAADVPAVNPDAAANEAATTVSNAAANEAATTVSNAVDPDAPAPVPFVESPSSIPSTQPAPAVPAETSA